jgi:hypothetical protein
VTVAMTRSPQFSWPLCFSNSSPKYPLSDVRRTINDLRSARLAGNEEVNDLNIDERYFLQVQH